MVILMGIGYINVGIYIIHVYIYMLSHENLNILCCDSILGFFIVCMCLTVSSLYLVLSKKFTKKRTLSL